MSFLRRISVLKQLPNNNCIFGKPWSMGFIKKNMSDQAKMEQTNVLSSEAEKAVKAGSNADDIDYHLKVLENDGTFKEEIYDEWAATYDNYLFSRQYYAPSIISDKLYFFLDDVTTDINVLDFGCGTGLVGEEIVKTLKYKDIGCKIDGIDTSEGMIEQAMSKNVYNELLTTNIVEENLEGKDEYYDAIVSSGVFVDGHVSFDQVPNLLGYLKTNGLLIFTYRDSWQQQDNSNFNKHIKENKELNILFHEKIPYIGDVNASLVIAEKQSQEDSGVSFAKDAKEVTRTCKGKASMLHTYAEHSPLKFMELVIPLDYGQFQDNFVDFSNEYIDRLSINDKAIKNGKKKINYVDIGSCYGNTIIALLTKWKWPDVLSYWLQMEYKKLPLPNKEKFNVVAVDGSEMSLKYGKDKGLYDETYAQNFNIEWDKDLIKALNKCQVLTCLQTTAYMEDGVFEKVLREYYLNEESRKGTDKVLFWNIMCAFQTQDLSPEYLLRGLPNIEHKRIFIKHRMMTSEESANRQNNKESWSYLYAVYAKGL